MNKTSWQHGVFSWEGWSNTMAGKPKKITNEELSNAFKNFGSPGATFEKLGKRQNGVDTKDSVSTKEAQPKDPQEKQ